jgi:putative phosphonate catabolism associated alcohol dehydrogenase
VTVVGNRLRVRYARWDGVGHPFSSVTSTVDDDLAPGWALAAIDLATVCGSDLHTIEGRRDAPSPSILGHEQVGRVVAVSTADPPRYRDGGDVGVGDRVVWSVTAACGLCRRCLEGLEQKCAHLHKYGHEGLSTDWPLNGGFATHCLIRPGTTIVAVPDTIPDRVAAPASCATATVAAIFDVLSDGGLAQRRVLVTGAGMLGVTAAAMAKAGGADVTVCDPDPRRRSLARRFGADHTDDGSGTLDGFDVAIEVSGNAAAVEACLGSLGIGGRAVLAGSVASSRPVAIDPEHLIRNLVRVTGVHNYRPQHLDAAIQFLHQHHSRYPFAELVADGFGLDDVDAAVSAASGASALRQAIIPGS